MLDLTIAVMPRRKSTEKSEIFAGREVLTVRCMGTHFSIIFSLDYILIKYNEVKQELIMYCDVTFFVRRKEMKNCKLLSVLKDLSNWGV